MKLDVKIEELNLSKELVHKLENLEIYTLEDLWRTKRIYLKENNFTDSEIHQIQIQLQLRSIDFNRKIYKF